MKQGYVRLTEPLVRTGRPAPGELGRGARTGRRGIPRVRDAHGADAFGLFSCSKATNEVNYLAQKFARAVHRHATTSTAATAPDTLPASSV